MMIRRVSSKNLRLLGASGYTLLEMSLVIMILAILAAGGLSVFQKKTEADKLKTTIQRLDAIEVALKQYYQINGLLPCPSTGSDADSSDAFGFTPTPVTVPPTVNNYDTTNHRCIYTDACGSATSMCETGVIPIRTLNLPDEYMYDGWGRRFTYRLAGRLGSATEFDDEEGAGDLSIIDVQGNELTDINRPYPFNYGAAYVLFSHGRNGYYAWTKAGTRYSPGAAPGIETENNDHKTNKMYIQDVRTVYFDDILRFKKKSELAPPKLLVSPVRISQSVCNDAEMIVQNGTGTLSASANAATVGIANVVNEAARMISELCNGKMPAQEKCIPNYVWAGPGSGRPFPNASFTDCQPNGVQWMNFNLTQADCPTTGVTYIGVNCPAFTATLSPGTHCNAANLATLDTNTSALISAFYVDSYHQTVRISYTPAITSGTLKVQAFTESGSYTTPTLVATGVAQTVTAAAANYTFTSPGVLLFEVVNATCASNSGTVTITIQ